MTASTGQIVLHSGQESTPYTLVRSQRRSIGLEIGPQGLTVRAPLRASQTQIHQVLLDKSRWIQAKLHLLEQRQAAQEHLHWHARATLPYLGGQLQLELHPSAPRPGLLVAVAAQRWVLHLPGDPQASAPAIRALVWAWWLRQAHELLTQRLHHYAPQLGVAWRSLRLTNARTRWGSARQDGSIMLNAKLLHYPQPVLDYVVVHELAHLHEMNHGPRFWAWVAGICPDYPALRAALRQQAAPIW